LKELITIEQTNHLMMAVIVIAPVVGLLIGAIVKNVKAYAIGGLAIGVGNYVLWMVYSAITNKLGLDTVVNLAVNLVLFIVVGVVVGIVIGKKQSKPEGSKE